MSGLSDADREDLGLVAHDRWCSTEHLGGAACDCSLLGRIAAAERVVGRQRNAAVERFRKHAVEQFLAELVCCDIYERLVEKPGEWTIEDRANYHGHSICYWGAAGAALVDDLEFDDGPTSFTAAQAESLRSKDVPTFTPPPGFRPLRDEVS